MPTKEKKQGGARKNAGRKTDAKKAIRHGYRFSRKLDVDFRLNEKEDSKFRAAVKKSGLTRSEFVRAAIKEKIALMNDPSRIHRNGI